MPRQLIINADDFGLSPAVSRGILHVHQHGVVTSTTVMIGIPGADDAVRTALTTAPALGLGLHITLAGYGCPPILHVDQVPTLVRADGMFYDEPAWSAHAAYFAADEITREIQAQFDRFVAVAGRLPTHLDSHYHAAYRHPAALDALQGLAVAHNLPLRHPGLDGLSLKVTTPALLVDGPKTLADLAIKLTTLPAEGVAEMIYHPGYVDHLLLTRDTLTTPREAELRFLTDPAVRAALADAACQLVTFAVLTS